MHPFILNHHLEHIALAGAFHLPPKANFGKQSEWMPPRLIRLAFGCVLILILRFPYLVSFGISVHRLVFHRAYTLTPTFSSSFESSGKLT